MTSGQPPVLNREAVELALPGPVRGYMYDLLRAWGIHTHERWPDHPLICDYLTLTAVQTLRDRKLPRGTTHTAALREACQELGLPYEATRSRLFRAGKTHSGANPTLVANRHEIADSGR